MRKSSPHDRPNADALGAPSPSRRLEFRDLAETFEDEEQGRFGPAGFEGIVDKVAEIEKSLGSYDLGQFTPK